MFKLIGSDCTAFEIFRIAFLCSVSFSCVRVEVWYEYTFDTSSVHRPAFSSDRDVPRLRFLGCDDYELYLASLLHRPQDGVAVQVSLWLFSVNEGKVEKKIIPGILYRAWTSTRSYSVALQLRGHLFYCSIWISSCWLRHTGSTKIHLKPTRPFQDVVGR